MEINKVAIIGAGPAGISVAIQLKRFGIDPLVFESEKIGGLLLNANLVENYPGFPGGISGIELVALMKRQFIDHDIELLNENITNVEVNRTNEYFELDVGDKKYLSEYLVVASGTKSWKLIGFEHVASDLHYEVKELADIVGKHVVIIGAGDAAFDYAINLSKNNEVSILNRGVEKKCLPLLWERSQKIEQITYLENAQIESVSKMGDRLEFSVDRNGEKIQLKADKLLAAIGREPQLSFMSKSILDKKDELISKERLYFIGDVNNDIFRQTSIAVGNGVITAMKIYKKTLEGSA